MVRQRDKHSLIFTSNMPEISFSITQTTLLIILPGVLV